MARREKIPSQAVKASERAKFTNTKPCVGSSGSDIKESYWLMARAGVTAVKAIAAAAVHTQISNINGKELLALCV
jgi:hypothetical protein